jgi:outer membrane protein assembly factor BamB
MQTFRVHKLTRTALLLVLVTARLAIPIAHAANEWPQFRGPDGQGHSDAHGVPLTWSETENVKWKTPIPGEGWSSPVVSGNQIWMTTALDDGQSLHAVCVDFDTGQILNDVEVFHVDELQPKHDLNSYASPTPVIDGDFVYVDFGRYGTACLATKTAQVLWRNHELQVDHQTGPGSSPVLYRDKLIVVRDGIDEQFVAALDTRSGAVVWKTDRSVELTKQANMHKSFCTPLVIAVDGKDQLISPAAEWLYAYEPDTGKELWRVHYPGYSNVPRPVYGLGLLFVATGFDRPQLWAIKPGGAGDLSATNVVWKIVPGAPAQPSPVLVGERLYVVNDSGIATCIEAKSGVVKWKERLTSKDELPALFSASPLFADGRIYFFDRQGITIVIEPGDTFKTLAKNELRDGCMASPAVVGKSFVVRTKTALYRIGE